MKTNYKILIFGCVLLTAFAGEASATITLSGGTPGTNSQDLQPPQEDTSTEILVNRLDCEENIDLRFTFEETSNSSDGDFYIVVGSECKDEGKDDQDCLYLEGPAVTEGTITRNLRTLLSAKNIESADDCIDGGSGSVSVWVARVPDPADRDPSQEDWSSSSVKISWDMDPPDPPEGIGAQPGENKVEITWNGNDQADAGETGEGLDDDVKTIRIIYMSSAALESGEDTEAVPLTEEDTETAQCPTDGFQSGEAYQTGEYEEKETTTPSGGSYSVTGLTNGRAYKFGVVSLDDYRNPSTISETVCSAPGKTNTFLDDYIEAGGKSGEYCFVATAAFGSYDHPTVRLLRQFRDKFLTHMPGGTALTATYYRIGPTLAAGLAERPAVRAATRGVLSAFALATVPLSALGPLMTLLIGIAIIGVFIGARRRTKRRR